MTIAQHVHAQWALLQPEKIYLIAGYAMRPDFTITEAVTSLSLGRIGPIHWRRYVYQDGSCLYRGGTDVHGEASSLYLSLPSEVAGALDIINTLIS